jgi:hypothetical protein
MATQNDPEQRAVVQKLLIAKETIKEMSAQQKLVAAEYSDDKDIVYILDMLYGGDREIRLLLIHNIHSRYFDFERHLCSKNQKLVEKYIRENKGLYHFDFAKKLIAYGFTALVIRNIDVFYFLYQWNIVAYILKLKKGIVLIENYTLFSMRTSLQSAEIIAALIEKGYSDDIFTTKNLPQFKDLNITFLKKMIGQYLSELKRYHDPLAKEVLGIGKGLSGSYSKKTGRYHISSNCITADAIASRDLALDNVGSFDQKARDFLKNLEIVN